MRRIMVIGSGGSGKSTLARRLGEALRIEVIHLDVRHWQPGWVEPPKDVWRRMVEEIVKQDEWIIDGNYSGTIDIRLAACDTVIFLDLPRLLCIWRVLKRILLYRKGQRPDMAAGCDEKFDLKFMRWIWEYPQRTRPRIVELLRNESEGKRIIWLRSRAEVEKFLERIGWREAVCEV